MYFGGHAFRSFLLTVYSTMSMFRCDEKALEDSLCKRVIVTRGESITKNLDPDAAAFSRDALARIVYSRLFDWYVLVTDTTATEDLTILL